MKKGGRGGPSPFWSAAVLPPLLRRKPRHRPCSAGRSLRSPADFPRQKLNGRQRCCTDTLPSRGTHSCQRRWSLRTQTASWKQN